MSTQQRNDNDQATHQQVVELLPWFINGTLNEIEQSLVSDHLNECSECSSNVQDLLEASRLINSREDDSSSAVFQRARDDFLGQLDTVSQPKSKRIAPDVMRRAWAIPSALAACLLVAGIFIGGVLMPRDGFKTLSDTVTAGNPVIQIVFQPQTLDKSTYRQLFVREGRIISGPSSQGVYRLELMMDKNPDEVLKRIRAHPDVQFAQLEDNP